MLFIMEPITSDILNILAAVICCFCKSLVPKNVHNTCHCTDKDNVSLFLLLTLFTLCWFVSIAIGREGGVVPLIALARSEAAVSIIVNFFIAICFDAFF